MNSTKIKRIKIHRKDKKTHYVVSVRTSYQLEKMRDDFAKQLGLSRITAEQFMTILIQKIKSRLI